MQNIRGYIDRVKIVVNLACQHAIGQFVHSVEEGGMGKMGSVVILANCENMKIWYKIQVIMHPFMGQGIHTQLLEDIQTKALVKMLSCTEILLPFISIILILRLGYIEQPHWVRTAQVQAQPKGPSHPQRVKNKHTEKSIIININYNIKVLTSPDLKY